MRRCGNDPWSNRDVQIARRGLRLTGRDMRRRRVINGACPRRSRLVPARLDSADRGSGPESPPALGGHSYDPWLARVRVGTAKQTEEALFGEDGGIWIGR